MIFERAFFSQPIQAFVFFFKHSPLWLSFQNWLFVKHFETHSALAYLFTIAHTFLKRSPVWQAWIPLVLGDYSPPFGGLGWQCVSRICSTSFGLSLGQSLSRSPSSFCFLTLFVSRSISLPLFPVLSPSVNHWAGRPPAHRCTSL